MATRLRPEIFFSRLREAFVGWRCQRELCYLFACVCYHRGVLLSRTMTADTFSRKVLQFDGGFLLLAGGAAMIMETVGHFFGVGPLGQTKGSPYTIGGFEAHGLAIIFAILLIRAASLPDRSLWHRVGLVVHLLLGCSNLLYWSSFVQLNVIPMGVITTVLHIAFVIAHWTCLRWTSKR